MEIDWSSHFHRLLHKQVTRVALEQWSMTLLIDDSELRVEGDWYLYGTNNIFDKNQGFIERQAFELWRLIGTEITRIDVFNEHLPKIFFYFTEEWRLELLANNDGLEDWALVTPNSKLFCDGESTTVFSS